MFSIQQPLLRSMLLLPFIYLGGCSQTPFIKLPVNAYHDIEGGIVSQPRLPVPGDDQKYPYVGLTPTAPPPLPSQELRNSITDSLAQDRNLTEWQNVQNPYTIPAIPAAPNQSVNKTPSIPPQTSTTQQNTTAPHPNEDQASSASFDAAGQSPTNQNPGETGKKETPKPSKNLDKQKNDQKTAPVVMPELRTKIDDQNVVIPSIPVNPPNPPKFPGFNVPTDVNLPPPTHPSALSFANPPGELIRFPIDSDTPYAKQEKTINNIAWQRNGKTLYVHGYGDTNSLDPDTQAKALSLALLRAKTVAKLLISHNVPESAIVIRAHAFGHGVRIRTDN